MAGNSVMLSGNLEKDMEVNGFPDTSEGRAMMAMTYVAAFSPGSTISTPFGNMEDIVVTAKYPRNYVPTIVDDAIERGEDSLNGETPTYVPPRGSEDEYGDYKMTNIAKCPDEDIRALFNSVVAGATDWMQYFIDLLAAHQVKALNARHVKSYFSMRGTHSVEGELISRKFPLLTGGMPNIAGTEGLRAMMTEGEWKKYRLTFASGLSLINKMLAEVPSDYMKFFSLETKEHIRLATENPHSQELYRRIPRKALGITYSYLMATDQLTEGLQGMKRAYDDLNISEKESLKNWFKDALGKMKFYKGGLINAGKMPDSLSNI
jgi:hypothetical protein